MGKMMNKKRLYIMFTIIALLLVSVVTVGSSHSAPIAGNACSNMGSYMERGSTETIFFKGVIKPEAPNRKWTVEELFRSATEFTSYNGEGEGTYFYANKVDRGKDRVGEEAWNAEGVQDNLKSARTSACYWGRGDFVSILVLKMAGGMVNLVSWTTSSLVGKDFMVEGLVKIIGGDGDVNGGLIGTFTHSIYMPLVVIAFILTAATIIYKGLIQMKMREALSAIIWSVGSFVIGLTLMLNPQMLASAPQQITSTITSCVVGALNGENCLTGEVTTPSILTGTECRSQVAGDENNADMMVNGMNCTIWKAFVLEPWAEEQFGVPYSQLYTHNVPEGGSLWDNLPEGKGKDYCVNLASTKSANDFNGYKEQTFIVEGAEHTVDVVERQPVVMDLDSESTVCNVALYQLYLKTEMEDKVNHEGKGYKLTKPEDGKPYDARWFDIIVPMAQDSSNWKNWTGQGRFFPRLGTAGMGLFAVMMASVVLFVLSIFGAAYKITGVIMMAFAPLFLLFAIEPNRGRKIFLGWLETLVSSLLKYFAITMLIVVSLVLYSGVLTNTSSIASFVSVIILTVALSMYRKEIVDLIGASNMGGQRLSNKVAKGIDGANKQIKQKGSAYVGGRVGGAVGALQNRSDNRNARKDTISNLQTQLNNATSEEDKDILNKAIADEQEALKAEGSIRKTAKSGAKQGGSESLTRAMKRGTSATSAAFRQADKTRKDLANEDKKASKDTKVDSKDSGNNINTAPYNKDKGVEGIGRKDGKVEEELTINSQRDSVKLSPDLSPEEKIALDNFADQLSNTTDNKELTDVANSEEVKNNKDKKAIVANEINARLKYNSLNGTSSGALALHDLSNPRNLTNEELDLKVNVHKENYLETGDKRELEKFKDASIINNERNGTAEDAEEKTKKQIKEAIVTKQLLDKTDTKYTRDKAVPTNKEYEENPEKYIRPENLTTPKELIKIEEERKKKAKSVNEAEAKEDNNKKSTNTEGKNKDVNNNKDVNKNKEVNKDKDVNKNKNDSKEDGIDVDNLRKNANKNLNEDKKPVDEKNKTVEVNREVKVNENQNKDKNTDEKPLNEGKEVINNTSPIYNAGKDMNVDDKKIDREKDKRAKEEVSKQVEDKSKERNKYKDPKHNDTSKSEETLEKDVDFGDRTLDSQEDVSFEDRAPDNKEDINVDDKDSNNKNSGGLPPLDL